ncbi:hypothetical protein COW46_00735 [Candidatus Gracilibacteria bacterium CG17_big_fil_post_rev_8_21_14_2_50_48_13]|nr:MAG: hypothetical protein COW46_00735 [Candidatus Gracilibacteria bacterium CG17_big_fil_post_rev_8_21_14_2_50_48_13]
MSTFRPVYKELSEATKERIDKIKEQAEVLLALMVDDNGSTQAGSRELSLAKTKLEESVMWAVKHWTA